MRYCTKCGEQLMDEYLVCPNCGCPTGSIKKENSGLKTIIKVFLIIGCVLNALILFLIPLIWCIPMTIYYFNAVKKNEKVGLAFKICTIIFVSTIAGILLFVDENN